jgi:hypothetical protein
LCSHLKFRLGSSITKALEIPSFRKSAELKRNLSNQGLSDAGVPETEPEIPLPPLTPFWRNRARFWPFLALAPIDALPMAKAARIRRYPQRKFPSRWGIRQRTSRRICDRISSLVVPTSHSPFVNGPSKIWLNDFQRC